MKWAVALILPALLIALPCAAAATKTKAHSAKKSASKVRPTSSSARSVSARKGVSSSRTRTASRRGRQVSRAAASPPVQSHPDPERYQQIQQALSDRGYYKGAVDGEWNGDSTDALKRFQADQKMEPDGKINSLSLINLGLGPKHDGSAVASTSVSSNPPPPQPPN